TRWRLRAAATLAGVGLVLVLGCGGDEFAKRYPVSGMVKYKREPVEKGRISFIPSDQKVGRTAAGEIPDGRDSLTTATQDDGALPGSYKVTVVSRVGDPAADAAVAKEAGQGPGHQGSPAFIKALKSEKPVVPAKYQLAETSSLTAEVKEQSNTLNFDLE